MNDEWSFTKTQRCNKCPNAAIHFNRKKKVIKKQPKKKKLYPKKERNNDPFVNEILNQNPEKQNRPLPKTWNKVKRGIYTLSTKRGSKSPERAPFTLPSISHWILACLEAERGRKDLRGRGRGRKRDEEGTLRNAVWGFRGSTKSI